MSEADTEYLSISAMKEKAAAVGERIRSVSFSTYLILTNAHINTSRRMVFALLFTRYTHIFLERPSTGLHCPRLGWGEHLHKFDATIVKIIRLVEIADIYCTVLSLLRCM